jgi:hypothetical protein
VRAQGTNLRKQGTELAKLLRISLHPRGAALSGALKLRALLVVGRAFALSKRIPQLARAAWAHLPDAARLPRHVRLRLQTGIDLLGPQLHRLSVSHARSSRRQVAHYGRSIKLLYGTSLRSLKRPIAAVSARICARSKPGPLALPASDRPSSISL